MAVIDPTFDESGWDAWVATRPAIIQDMARLVRYNRFYRMKTTGQICALYSYSEDGTVTVDVPMGWNDFFVISGISVFGVDPANLEECESPLTADAVARGPRDSTS